ncbi:hypothetical protein CPC08DRAFT_771499 [Agrocybe pediades]|nr:hypothetical protein CPC08DRAFT_771499 [Agrocybe pediades]
MSPGRPRETGTTPTPTPTPSPEPSSSASRNVASKDLVIDDPPVPDTGDKLLDLCNYLKALNYKKIGEERLAILVDLAKDAVAQRDAAAMAQNNTPAVRLITRGTERYLYPAIWGFPIDPVKVAKQYEEGNPAHGPDSTAYVRKTMREMQDICGKIVGEPLNKSRRRWDVGHRIHPQSTGNEVYVFAVVTLTAPDPRFIPDEEKIAELKAYFLKYGVTRNPSWYRSTM